MDRINTTKQAGLIRQSCAVRRCVTTAAALGLIIATGVRADPLLKSWTMPFWAGVTAGSTEGNPTPMPTETQTLRFRVIGSGSTGAGSLALTHWSAAPTTVTRLKPLRTLLSVR